MPDNGIAPARCNEVPTIDGTVCATYSVPKLRVMCGFVGQLAPERESLKTAVVGS